MRKLFLAFVIATLTLGCCTTSLAVDPPNHIATIGYRDYEYVTFSSTSEVTLSFIYCEHFDELVLLAEKIAYYPVLNETKYKFTSDTVSPEPWFIPGEKEFVYQDDVTGQLYIIKVDYSAVSVPAHPAEVLYDALLIEYATLVAEHDIAVADLLALQNSSDAVDAALSEYINTTGMTNASAALVITQLLEEHEFIASELNTTQQYLAELGANRTQLQQRYDNLSSNFTALESANSDLVLGWGEDNESFAADRAAFANSSSRLGAYSDFVDDMQSMQQGIFFDGRYYTTPYYHKLKVQQLDDAVGMAPIYVVLTGVIVGMVFFFIYRAKVHALPIPDTRIDTELRYPKDAARFDKFSMNKLFQKITKRKQSTTTPEEQLKTLAAEKAAASVTAANLISQQVDVALEKRLTKMNVVQATDEKPTDAKVTDAKSSDTKQETPAVEKTK